MSYLVIFFFLMIRRPPRSTLFPTRRSSDLAWIDDASSAAAVAGELSSPATLSDAWVVVDDADGLDDSGVAAVEARSEEHTSELQSQSNLVCRLLLEKKKKNKINEYKNKKTK